MNVEKFYINGEWVEPSGPQKIDIINPSSEDVIGKLSMGNEQDVNRAVQCAKIAFQSYRLVSKEERLAMLEKILSHYKAREKELQAAVTQEMGAPKWVGQVEVGRQTIEGSIEVLKSYPFEYKTARSLVKKVPVGVVGLITPWNWPLIVSLSKIVYAIASGCTMVFKPSEYSPLSAKIIAQIIHESGLPKGVFNMIFGHGEVVGRAISSHPDIRMVSLTGSTRAGIDVSKMAADTVKRVTLELGGKGPNIILPSANLVQSVQDGVKNLMSNSGQTCAAPSRMIVPKKDLAAVKAAILEVIPQIVVGNPEGDVFIGPVVNANQYKRIQDYIQSGIDEGATLITGGLGKPEGLSKGYYVRPTVFMDTTPSMKIVKEEIFGPVLVIQSYETLEEAIEIANDTPYGLSSYISGGTREEMMVVADRLESGQIQFGGASFDIEAPFGGVKASGNGRERGEEGLSEYLEAKVITG